MNIKKIQPLFTAVVVTAEIYPIDYKEKGLISIKANKLKEYQKVVAAGDACRGIKEGDLVCIDLSAYAQRKYKKNSVKADMEELTNDIVGYNLPQIEIDGKDCLYLDLRDVKYIVVDYDDKENTASEIVTSSKSIIL